VTVTKLAFAKSVSQYHCYQYQALYIPIYFMMYKTHHIL